MANEPKKPPQQKTDVRNGEFGHVTKTATTSHLGDKIAAVAPKPASTGGNTKKNA